eukprot:2395233-Amphidinium_carterae.1
MSSNLNHLADVPEGEDEEVEVEECATGVLYRDSGGCNVVRKSGTMRMTAPSLRCHIQKCGN